MVFKIFQSSLWSYILCPYGSGNPLLMYWNISIFFMKLYSMSYFKRSNDESICSEISIFFMKLYSMSYLNNHENNLQYLDYFNLLYEAIFYVLFSSIQTLLRELGIFQSSLWSYILCPTNTIRKSNYLLIRFQSSLWSYILCPYMKGILKC